MIIKPIKTEKDYNDALSRLELIFDSKKGSVDSDELEILGILIETCMSLPLTQRYENKLMQASLPLKTNYSPMKNMKMNIFR